MTKREAADQQAELATFLRSRRAGLCRAELGLPQLRTGGTHGLRREEVAVLVGVSITWYTWLEQGRNANPSRQVLDAIGRAFRLTTAEHGYLLALTGYGPPPGDGDTSGPPAVPDHVQRLLDGWSRAPAFVITVAWDIVAWNRAYATLYPTVAARPAGATNLLRAVFEDRDVRAMLPDWETDSAHFLAEFRADYAVHVSDPVMKKLIADLSRSSAEFAEVWSRHGIERFSSRMRRFRHPEIGELDLEVHRLTLSDYPGLHLIVYSPVPGVTNASAIEALATDVPSRRRHQALTSVQRSPGLS